MERDKGEYLDMDEDKRQQLDQQAEEYVDDVAEAPAMNAEPEAHYPDPGRRSPPTPPNRRSPEKGAAREARSGAGSVARSRRAGPTPRPAELSAPS